MKTSRERIFVISPFSDIIRDCRTEAEAAKVVREIIHEQEADDNDIYIIRGTLVELRTETPETIKIFFDGKQVD